MKKIGILTFALLTSLSTAAQSVPVARTSALVPSGPHNVVSGKVSADCTGDLTFAPNVKLRIADDGANTFTFSNGSGDYLMYTAPQGTITVTPEIQNNYFTFDPVDYRFDSESAGSQFSADFCLVPNGVHNDVQIEIVPLDHGRPGMNAHYKLIYTNSGTQPVSGRITLAYPEQSVDVIATAPSVLTSSQGLLNWAFQTLHPFESREIGIVVNVSASASAMGPTLEFIAEIHTDEADETPQDNIKSLLQSIVFTDLPNEKIVAQGQYISLDQLDEFLNYTIRFQNTGNYVLQNVVINDFIQTALDVTTLQTTTASHPYRATLKNNKLEIIFENINLPPASENEAASQGYATFKVKPKTSVGLGDVIQNTAEIYFDFNFPIITNTVTTTVMETLQRDAFDAGTFSVYPNPTSGVLHLQSKTPIDSIEIFNAMGQIVLTTTSTQIDTTAWAKGFYMLRATASGKTSSQKFLKL